MSKIYPIRMNLSYILALFSANNKMKFVKYGKEYTLFEVYSLKDARELEKLFLSHSNTERKIITNNQGKKPLIMSVEFRKSEISNMWRFKIFQKGSKGITLDTYQTLKSLPSELYIFLKPLEDDFRNFDNLNRVNLYFDKRLKDYMHSIHLLYENDLNYFLSKKYLTQFEIKQVTWTYLFYKNDYDFYTERIDDYVTEMKAKESNETIREIISLCEQISKKHSNIEKLFNKKGEVWKYWKASQDHSWFVLFL